MGIPDDPGSSSSVQGEESSHLISKQEVAILARKQLLEPKEMKALGKQDEEKKKAVLAQAQQQKPAVAVQSQTNGQA
ncbi:hypothetical protein V5O48_013467, partial [Marasmius crinis-equi]